MYFNNSELKTFDSVRDYVVRSGIAEKVSLRDPSYGLSKSNDELLVGLVGQIAAIGNNTAQDNVQDDPELRSALTWKRLSSMDDEERHIAIWTVLRAAGSRYARKDVAHCVPSQKLSASVAAFAKEGSPKAYVAKLAKLPSDVERLNMVRGIPSLSGGKSPRDFLTTKLGMARNFIALDIRIMQVLHAIAPSQVRKQATPGSDDTYNRIEAALVEQVCPRFGISPAELDQWLFRANKDNRLVKHLQSL